MHKWSIRSVSLQQKLDRISTLYAALDVSENERQLFYRDMGHRENIYQTPLAEAEILTVGSQLQLMDGH